jgi:hypothetical protein
VALVDRRPSPALSNARGVAALSQADGVNPTIQGERMKILADAGASVNWDRI